MNSIPIFFKKKALKSPLQVLPVNTNDIKNVTLFHAASLGKTPASDLTSSSLRGCGALPATRGNLLTGPLKNNSMKNTLEGCAALSGILL